jgi:DNA-binding CsgD family transcriptional regulator
MGIARLLAKGWLLVCLVAGGHALHLALASGMAASEAWLAIGVCVLLFAAMGKLSLREKTIMETRFGLSGHEEMTQKEVAEMLGISQSYISRLEKRIIRKLQKDICKAE